MLSPRDARAKLRGVVLLHTTRAGSAIDA